MSVVDAPCIIPASLHVVFDPSEQLHCLTTQSLRRINRDGVAFLDKLLQHLTLRSAKSQALVAPITTIVKLIASSDRLYIITLPSPSSPSLHALVGYVRVCN